SPRYDRRIQRAARRVLPRWIRDSRLGAVRRAREVACDRRSRRGFRRASRPRLSDSRAERQLRVRCAGPESARSGEKATVACAARRSVVATSAQRRLLVHAKACVRMRHRILVLEDDPAIAAELRELFETLEYEFVHAPTLDDALPLIERADYCVAL